MYRDIFAGGGGGYRGSENAITQMLHRDGFPQLASIYNALVSGQDTHKIEAKHNVTSDHIDKAKRHLIRLYPDLYEKVAGKPASPYRFLIDENIFFKNAEVIDRNVVSLWADFGRVSHVRHEHLDGERDKNIWGWARNNSVNAIITQDVRMNNKHRDLSLIALHRAHKKIQQCFEQSAMYDTRHLPVIIQITPQTDDPKQTMDSLRQHRDSIIKFLDNPESVILRLSPNGAKPILNYKEIAMEEDWAKLNQLQWDRYKNSSPSPT